MTSSAHVLDPDCEEVTAESTSTVFSDRAWYAVQGTYEQILDHPFLTALTDGTLERSMFARYLVDDAHYLVEYARVLATVGARLPEPDMIAQLTGSASGALLAERVLHERFVGAEALTTTEPTITCHAYTGFLAKHAAWSPVEVAMAAVLPCFRVYAEVGQAIAARAPESSHPYAAWISTYADEDFAESVRAAEATTDRLAAASPHVEAMHAAYAAATAFEWHFWDAAWKGVGPVTRTVG